MKRLIKIFSVICLLLVVLTATGAKVYTSDEKTHTNACYVVGNKNFFPVEYYNYTTKNYEGVIPEILNRIAKNANTDIVYLEKSEETPETLLEKGEVDIISAYVDGSASDAVEKTVPVFEYEYEGQPLSVSFGFGKNADPKFVEMVEAELAKITENEITGYFVEASLEKPDNSLGFAVMITVLCMSLVLMIVFLWMKLMGMRKQMQINIMTDADTGLDNLLCFEHRFEHDISPYSRSAYYIAYLVLDINYFKATGADDNMHEIIKHTASVLKSYAKHNEIAARITENGFALCFHSPSEAEAENRLEKLMNKLYMYSGGTKEDNKVFYAAFYHLKETDGNSDLLLFNLRRNCNKIVGNNQNIVFCDDELMNSEIAEKRLIDSVSAAVKNKEFVLYLQFIVDSKDKKIVSAEALSRWHQPDGTVLTPASYIEPMETASLIGEHDFYMFDLICRQLHKWHDTEFDNISISCNFTRITLSEADFTDRIKEITSRYVFDKSKLIIEITEDSIEKNRDAIVKNVLLCKELGIKVALDDMGSGYTSLVNLCEYPIDIVKIDRDILLKTSEKNGKDLFMGMVALAHNLGLKVVSEGVETEEQSRMVTDSGCDYIQGFYYSRARQAEFADAFLKEYESGVGEVNK